MKQEFRVWAPGDSHEAEATLVMDVHDAQEAAKEFVEANHGDFDFSNEVDVCVMDSEGMITQWTVTAEQTVTFHAERKK